MTLLIKSKYAVIFLETADEEYVLQQLAQIAQQSKFSYFQWSVTDGLHRGHKEGSYYQTKEPVLMLKTIFAILGPVLPPSGEAGLFVFKDFERYLDNSLVLRLFKDLVNRIKNTRNTVIIVASAYKLPQDIEPYAAHIIGGYPAEDEISTVINETIEELFRSNPHIRVLLTAKQTRKIAKTLNGLSVQQIRNVISECVLDSNKLDMQDLPKIENCKKKIFDREGILEFCLSESRDNIADFDNLKRWLAERKHAFQTAVSLPPPKGVLMMGVQGCGKSLAIKVVARELNLPLYRLDLTKLYSKYIGETEQNLRKALKIVEKLSPMCLWIDEIEKCFAASDGEVDGGVSQRVLGTFLTWMQERQGGCFIAATANNIYMLPPEFLRKGRFDEIFFVDLPNFELRKDIFRIHLTKRGLKPEAFDCGLLAEESADFNGAEIEQVVISALYRARSEKEPISTDHILEQLRSTKPLAVVKREDVAMLRDWAKDRTISA